ncbi:DNA primase [Sphingosinithalassobacter sp. LHW66-3]|uniref:DNA primase n=1 Tax=Sphingosinithalassobacter sp. LHW66-3 TaxID=3424718 RepID=UPI003D6BAF59
MGGHQIPEQGPNDDGYDESQRAEVFEATRGGPNDGTVQTDMDPDLGEELDDVEGEDDLAMRDREIGEEDPDARLDRDDRDEDDLQADYDNDAVDQAALDAEGDDGDDAALAP